MRIGANSGIGKVGASHLPDGAGLGDADGIVETTALLSGEETVALDAMLVASTQNELASVDRSANPTRVESKATVPSAAWSIPESMHVSLAPQATIPRPIHDGHALQAEQGANESVPPNQATYAGPSSWEISVEAAQSAASLKFITAAAAASQLVLETPRAEAAVASTGRASVGDGHAGQRNSSSDEEQSKRCMQPASMEGAVATTEKLVPGWYQPPLFNRRLETNGVDDALLLATDAARREALSRRHDKAPIVPPIQPVVHVVAGAPVVAEAEIATARSNPDKQAGPAHPSDAFFASELDVTENIEASVAIVAIAAAPTNQFVKRYKIRHRLIDDSANPPLSDPRGINAAERADCWVPANVPGGLIQGLRRPVRSQEQLYRGYSARDLIRIIYLM